MSMIYELNNIRVDNQTLLMSFADFSAQFADTIPFRPLLSKTF